jgi:hypothetical protein
VGLEELEKEVVLFHYELVCLSHISEIKRRSMEKELEG